MRPDLDEYEELNPELGAPRSRAMSWIVLGVAVLGFGALAYYAYQSGSQSVADGQMLIVEADETPIKEAPANAGGEEFPHKDKTIYDALSPYRTDPKVETLLPAAEEPVIPEPAVSNGTTAPKPAETTSYVKPEPKAVEETPAEPAKAAEPLKIETVEVKDSTVATKATPAPVAKPTPAPAPKPVVKAEPKPTPAPAAKPAPTPVASSGGNYKVQLGAYASDAEARQNWSKITAKHGDVIKGSPIIVKADVNGKTFYRLRASGFASADAAKSACTTLSSRKQACFPAGQ